tara:strand:- start:7 stop:951 length:945 start_codon:yes stop_codon:yes gene_type:complete
MKRNLLITGSSGYVGQEFILDEKVNNFQVISLDKDKKNNPDINLDLNDLSLTENLKTNLKGHKNLSILNLAAARTDYASHSEYISDNVDGTKNFLNALEACNIKIDVFVHISSIAVFEGFELINNKADLNALSSDESYKYSKAMQEIFISNWCIENNINLIIIRPAAIFSKFGPKNTNTKRLFTLLKYSPIIFSSKAKKSLTYVKNLVENIYLALCSKETGTMLAVEKPMLSVNDIQRIVLKNKKLFSLRIKIKKKSLLRISFFLTRFLGIFLSDPIFTPNRVEKFFKSTGYLEEGNLSYVQTVPIKEALEKSL